MSYTKVSSFLIAALVVSVFQPVFQAQAWQIDSTRSIYIQGSQQVQNSIWRYHPRFSGGSLTSIQETQVRRMLQSGNSTVSKKAFDYLSSKKQKELIEVESNTQSKKTSPREALDTKESKLHFSIPNSALIKMQRGVLFSSRLSRSSKESSVSSSTSSVRSSGISVGQSSSRSIDTQSLRPVISVGSEIQNSSVATQAPAVETEVGSTVDSEVLVPVILGRSSSDSSARSRVVEKFSMQPRIEAPLPPVGLMEDSGPIDTSSIDLTSLTSELSFFPTNLVPSVQDLLSLQPKVDGNVSTFSKDNMHLYVWRNGRTVQRTVLFIEGDTTPNYAKGLWNQLNGSTLQNVIISSVPVQYSEENIPAAALPGRLRSAVANIYGGSIDFTSGTHAKAQLELNGVLRDVLRAANYPTENLIVTIGKQGPALDFATGGAVAAEKSKKNGDIKEALKPTNYIEVTRVGVWSNPLDMQRTTLTNATVYLDDGPAFGFWGKGTFDNEKFSMFYQGPLKFSKDPYDYLEAQAGFGAETMGLPQYIKLVSAYNSRFPGSQYAFMGSADSARDASLDAVFSGLDALPLDLLELKNSRIKNVNLVSGSSFPGREVFNAMVLGPLATGKDGTNGPLIHIDGAAHFINQQFGTFQLDIDTSGVKGSTNGTIAIPLGKASGQDLGSIGGNTILSIVASPTDQQMTLQGNVGAGPLNGRDIAIDITRSRFYFSSPASCVFPFDLKAKFSVSDPRNLRISDIAFVPEMIVPDPTALLSCPEDIFYLIEGGVVLAFNGTIKLAEFANSYLPENEVTKIGIEGLKIGGGIVTKAPEEIVNVAKSIPGVSESLNVAGGALGELGGLVNTVPGAGELMNMGGEVIGGATGLVGDGVGEVVDLVTEVPGAEEAAKAAEEAKKAAEKAAKEAVEATKRAAEKAAEEARRAAEQLGNAAEVGGKFVGDIASGAANAAVGGFSDAMSGFSSGLSGLGGSVGIGGGSAVTVPPSVGWTEVGGGAIDVGVSHVGNHIFVVGSDTYVYKRIRSPKGEQWIRQGDQSNFLRVDAGDDGTTIAVKADSSVWYFSGKKWYNTGRKAVDVGIGGGFVWLVTNSPTEGGYQLAYSGYPKKEGATSVPKAKSNSAQGPRFGGANKIAVYNPIRAVPGAVITWSPKFVWNTSFDGMIRIDVDPNGNAWGINDKYQIFKSNNHRWTQLEGVAFDISIGAGFEPWIIAPPYDEEQGGGTLFRYQSDAWKHYYGKFDFATVTSVEVDEGATSISVGDKGAIWTTDVQQKIYRGKF